MHKEGGTVGYIDGCLIEGNSFIVVFLIFKGGRQKKLTLSGHVRYPDIVIFGKMLICLSPNLCKKLP